MVNFFGEAIRVEILLGLFAIIAVCLLAFRFSTVLFLTLVCLSLPSTQISSLYVFGRYFRWAFIAGLILKGLTANIVTGFVPRPVTFAHVCVLLIGFAAVLSFAYSIGPEVTLAHGGAMAALWLAVFAVLWNYWQSEAQIRELCTAIFYLACLLIGGSVVYTVLGYDTHNHLGRSYGIFTNPNGAGQAVAAFSPFVYLRYRDARPGAGKILILALSFGMVFVLVRSGSRSGILATVLCMGTVLALVHRIRLVAIAPLILLLVVPAALLGGRIDASSLQESSIIRLGSIETVGDRIPGWEKGFEIFQQRPFLGHGFGMSRFADIGHADFNLVQAVSRMRGANYHNAHLQLAIDLGMLGLLLFWLFLLSVFRSGVRVLRVPRGSSLAVLSAVFFGAFLALFADTWVHGWAFSPGSSAAITFWIIAAAVVRLDWLAREDVPPPRGTPRP